MYLIRFGCRWHGPLGFLLERGDVARPTEFNIVSARSMIEEINSSSSRSGFRLPFLAQPIPNVGISAIIGFLEFIEEGLEAIDSHSAEFITGWAFGIGSGTEIRHTKVTPEDLDIGIVAFTDVARDVEIVAGDVRSRVEEVDQVFSANDRANH